MRLSLITLALVMGLPWASRCAGLELSASELARLKQALQPQHARYDPAEQMLRSPFHSPGYHTTLKGGYVHSTRESFEYAVALLDTGDAELVKRAEGMLRRLIRLQDPNPESKTYGIWSWFLEEPLDKMSPPDWNWADFCGDQLLQVARDHRQRLPAELMAEVDAALKHATESIRRRNVGPAYSNIAVLGTYVTLVTAETLNLASLRQYAMERLRRLHAYTLEQGGFSEYNSPTYTLVTLEGLGRLRLQAQDPEARRLGDELYRLAWAEIAQHFHVPTRQWAGPHSRCYSTLLPGSTLAFIQRSTGGRVRFFADEPRPSSKEHRLRLPCPPDFEPFFARLDGPRDYVKTFVKGQPGIVGTTCLRPEFALGSVNRGNFWNQQRALVAYWGTAQAPAYLQVRFLHDGYDFCAAQLFSAQQGGSVLAGIDFGLDGGDTHPSLDRLKNGTMRAKDLRLRFELGGSAGVSQPAVPASLEERAALRFGKLRLHLSVPYAQWGATRGHWAAGSDAKAKKAWLDVILYEGEAREIVLADLEQAVLGVFIQFVTDDQPASTSTAIVQGGRLELAAAKPALQLSLPIKAGKISELQRAFKTSGGP